MAPNFEKFSPQNNEKEEKKKEGEITRRKFLKDSLAFGAALMDGRWAKNYISGEKDEAGGEKRKNNPLDEILDFEREGRVVLNFRAAEEIKAYWAERYMNSSLRKSLEDGYRNWGYWRPYTEKKFKEQGVPVEFARLALPETHWDVSAISRAGARGPYQFTRDTGKEYDLRMDKVIDERHDPIKSGEACAKNLKYLHETFHDWDVALSGYNGALIVWDLNISAKRNGQPTSYENYLKFAGEAITDIKYSLRANTLTHIARNSDTVRGISNYYGISEKELCQANKIKNNNIPSGRRLLISTTGLSHAEKKSLFTKLMRGYHENLNYVPKFRAINTLIEEGFVREQYPPVTFKKDRIERVRKTILSSAETEYEVIAKDNWYNIARKFKKHPKELIKYNIRKKMPFNIKPGDKILIPEDKRGKKVIHAASSLESEAKKRGKSLQKMTFLNPQILDVQAPLPDGTVIRV